jgi:DNA mismatch repair protein MutH
MYDRVAPPRSEAELLERAQELAGLSLGQLAARFGEQVPGEPRRAKGYAGRLLELALGADATSRPEPDFTRLGIELKTVPVDAAGLPQESTYLTLAPLRGLTGLAWAESAVRRKLARMLWVPVEGTREVPMAARRIGWPVLWSPSAEQEAALRRDWEELMLLLTTGQVSTLNARHGQWLQIRPKAANARALAAAHDETGAPAADLPRGFYLRARFTAQILSSAAGALA